MVKLFLYSLFSILILLNNESLAGAWPQKKGKSELEYKYENKILFTYFINPQDKSRYFSKAFILDLYSLHYQYGINDKLTLVIEEKWFDFKAKHNIYKSDDPAFNFHHQTETTLKNHFHKFENNPYETKISLQRLLWKNEDSILSIKPGFEVYNNRLDKAFEISLLFGTNFKIGDHYSYLNIEYAASENAKSINSYSNNITSKLEVTLGLAMSKKNTAIFKFFDSRNEGIYRNQNNQTAQWTLQRQIMPNIAWQTGYSTNISNRSKYIVESVITGITFKF